MDTEAQIENRLLGKWEFKGESEVEPGIKIHFIYEFRSDSSVILKGFLNKVDHIIIKGNIIKNIGKNKVEVFYDEFFFNDEEEKSNGYYTQITLVLLSQDKIKLVSLNKPTKYTPVPSKEEYILIRIK